MIHLSETEKTALLEEVIPAIEKEDRSKRDNCIRLWRQLEHYWEGLQSIFWDEVAKDWRDIRSAPMEAEVEREGGSPIYDYVINIMKPHGQAIISAISQRVPFPEYLPADADKANDVVSARAKTRLAVILQKRNDFKLLMMEALFKKFNQGVAFWYNYYERDRKYGTFDRLTATPYTEEVEHQLCPDCGAEDSFENDECKECHSVNPPTVEKREETQHKYNTETVNKGKECFKVFGPLNVKIPFYVTNLHNKDCGYLILYEDSHVSYFKEIFQDVKGFDIEKIIPTSIEDDTSRWGRDSSYYYAYPAGTEVNNITTSKKIWLRTWMFNCVREESTRNSLKKKFSNDNFYVCIVAKQIADCAIDRLDDRWTCGKSDLSTFIHSSPTGRTLLPVQEAKNSMFNLTLQTIENGIPSIWADPQYVDFDKFQNSEASPGLMYPLKTDLRPNDNIAAHFYETGKSSLSREIDLFDSKIDTTAQFVVGSFPSIYGGPSTGKSRTLGEYQQSRAMALQRLTIMWDYTKREIVETVDKGEREFLSNMEWDDEKIVSKEGDSYKNYQVQLSDLRAGETGEILIQSDEDFPLSVGQKRELFMELMQMNNEVVGQILNHPQNIPVITQILGSPEIYIPGSDQRIKQLEEITELSQNQPAGQTQPSISIDPEIDDSSIHAQVLRAFLTSPEGTELKEQFPEGFNNCKLHLLEHLQDIEQKMQMHTEESLPSEPHRVR